MSDYKRAIWMDYHHRLGLAGEGHADVIQGHLERIAPRMLLDVGSGTEGARLRELSRFCERLTVIERSPRAIDMARRDGAEGSATFVAGEAERLPLAGERVDAVTVLGLFAHVREPNRVFAELHRVSRPGALCFVTNAVAHPIDTYLRLGLDAGFSLVERHEGTHCPAASGAVKERYLLVFGLR